MINCYDEHAYAFWSGVLGMIIFMPIVLICVGGAVAKAVAFLMKLKEILKWKR